METPEVHILMPARNAESFIKASLQSALSQDHSAQILVYNDGSTDGTEAIVRELSASTPQRIHLAGVPVSQGIGHARNELIRLSCELNPAAMVLWLDSDDCLADEHCVGTVAEQMRRTGAEICFMPFNVVWENNSEELKKSAGTLLKLKEGHETVLAEILTSPGQVVSFNTCPNILNAAPHGWTKAYAPSMKKDWAYSAEGSYAEDIPHMALLFKAERITAVDRPIINYLRRNGSVTGNRTPDHFIKDMPDQLRCFQSHVDMSDAKKAAGATSFLRRRFDSIESMVAAFIDAKKTGFTPEVMATCRKNRKALGV